jgi:Phytanoyl-CoA dioxygenase (PhyH)
MFRAGIANIAQGTTDDFSNRGIAIYEYALTPADIATMERAFPQLGQRTAGARANAFTPQDQDWFASHGGLPELASRLIGSQVSLTRIQAFDKSAGANWFVPWHQDRAEDGRERPVEELERTVALRIHLDDCNEDNGPLEVLPGSHTHGRLDASAIARLSAHTPSLVCLANRGDIVTISPLIVHRSQRARRPAARRVIHLEYTATKPAI